MRSMNSLRSQFICVPSITLLVVYNTINLIVKRLIPFNLLIISLCIQVLIILNSEVLIYETFMLHVSTFILILRAYKF